MRLLVGTIAPRTHRHRAPTVTTTPHSTPVLHGIVPLMTFVPAAQPRRVAAATALAFAITAIGLLLAPAPTYAWDVNAFSSASEKQLVALTNQSRAAAGLKALRVDSTLTAVARSRSKDMIVRNYFSHSIPPTGKNVFSILDSKGYCYYVAGENIGWNNYPDDVATQTVHRQFMASSGHRANILGKRWDVLGVGAYKGPTGKKMWTVIFADRCGTTTTTTKPAPKPVAKPKATPKPTPKPTPVPTPTPTPVATPPTPERTPEPTDPIGLGFGPGGRGNGGGNGSDNGDGGASGGGPPPGQQGGNPSDDRSNALRVVDPPTAPGLFETIVADVTGFFLGG
jgi:uncharacterized protein YkwD